MANINKTVAGEHPELTKIRALERSILKKEYSDFPARLTRKREALNCNTGLALRALAAELLGAYSGVSAALIIENTSRNLHQRDA